MKRAYLKVLEEALVSGEEIPSAERFGPMNDKDRETIAALVPDDPLSQATLEELLSKS